MDQSRSHPLPAGFPAMPPGSIALTGAAGNGKTTFAVGAVVRHLTEYPHSVCCWITSRDTTEDVQRVIEGACAGGTPDVTADIKARFRFMDRPPSMLPTLMGPIDEFLQQNSPDFIVFDNLECDDRIQVPEHDPSVMRQLVDEKACEFMDVMDECGVHQVMAREFGMTEVNRLKATFPDAYIILIYVKEEA